MDRMERRNAAFEALRRAQQEHAHLQARADELASAYHDIQRNMRDSGEHDRRVADYKHARSEFYAKKNEAYQRTSQRMRVLGKLRLLYYLLLGLALLFIFRGCGIYLSGEGNSLLIVGVILLLSLWGIMGLRLSARQSELDEAYKRAGTPATKADEPPLTVYRLVESYPGGCGVSSLLRKMRL